MPFKGTYRSQFNSVHFQFISLNTNWLPFQKDGNITWLWQDSCLASENSCSQEEKMAYHL